MQADLAEIERQVDAQQLPFRERFERLAHETRELVRLGKEIGAEEQLLGGPLMADELPLHLRPEVAQALETKGAP